VVPSLYPRPHVERPADQQVRSRYAEVETEPSGTWQQIGNDVSG